jgi:hypothetical protein
VATGTSEGIGVENEFHRIIDALVGLLWTALPDRHSCGRP